MTAPQGQDRQEPEHRSDADALRSLSTAYASAADERDGDRFADLFVDAGALLVPDLPDDFRPVISRVGREALRQVPELLRRYARTFHLVSNHRFSFDGDRATGEVLCLAHHVMAAHPDRGGDWPGIDTVWFIRYLDDYLRTDRGWRFVQRALHLQWVEEHPVSMLPTAVDSDHRRPGS